MKAVDFFVEKKNNNCWEIWTFIFLMACRHLVGSEKQCETEAEKRTSVKNIL